MPTIDPTKVPDDKVKIRDFAGLASYVDPHDVSPGAGQIQINAVSTRPGELRVRPGYKRVMFDE